MAYSSGSCACVKMQPDQSSHPHDPHCKALLPEIGLSGILPNAYNTEPSRIGNHSGFCGSPEGMLQLVTEPLKPQALNA